MRRILVIGASAAILGLPTYAGATTPSVIGRGAGHWHHVAAKVADLPSHDVLHGHGTFGGKTATVTGRVTGLGFIARGRCTVNLHLTTASGAIVVRGASVKLYPGFSECGNDFAFRYHSHQPTGSYAGDSFKGRGHIVLKSAKETKSHTRRFVVRLS